MSLEGIHFCDHVFNVFHERASCQFQVEVLGVGSGAIKLGSHAVAPFCEIEQLLDFRRLAPSDSHDAGDPAGSEGGWRFSEWPANACWLRRNYSMLPQPSGARHDTGRWTEWPKSWPSPDRFAAGPQRGRSKTTPPQQPSNMLTKIEGAKSTGHHQTRLVFREALQELRPASAH